MLEALLDCQAKLIAALDAQDADDIIDASNALAAAVAKVKLEERAGLREQVAQGLKLAEAASIRVKYLTAWNRQKIDRLAEIRGRTSPDSYVNMRRRR
jgi:hypothetical protein